jgi:hypothetical protein
MTAEPITEQLPVTVLSPFTGGALRPGSGQHLAPIALAGVLVAGIVTLVAGVWGGIVPFAGPTFGLAPANSTTWHWSLADATQNAVPGAVAVVCGLLMLLALLRVRRGAGRVLLVPAGILAAAAGAWMVLAPWAFPLVSGTQALPRTLTSADFWRLFGYHLGPGVVLVASGVAAALLGNQHRTVRFALVEPRVSRRARRARRRP